MADVACNFVYRSARIAIRGTGGKKGGKSEMAARLSVRGI